MQYFFDTHSSGSHDNDTNFTKRRKFLVVMIVCGMSLLALRAIHLQVVNKQFLQKQGAKRHISEVPVAAYRGKILDRDGEILAISSPVQSVWANPQEIDPTQQVQINKMAALLQLPPAKVQMLTEPESKQRFVYLARRITPDLADKVKQLEIEGVYFEREFKRFYPTGPMTAHVVGFTNADDIGQEGIERAYEESLKGKNGRKRVIRDGKRRIIEDVENINDPVPGKDLVLSIDRRLQYLAYRELQATYLKHGAKSASLVVLNAKTGEILAAVTQPGFNPNGVKDAPASYRNRAITDVFEPGSTMKPFAIAAALNGGYVDDNFKTNTPSPYLVGRNLVKDIHHYGVLDLTGILRKSSNVGTSIVALKVPGPEFWGIYNKLGFGTSAGVGFPSEARGRLIDVNKVRNFAQATLSFGYGISTSVLQLARAYTALADDGIVHSVSLLKRDYDPAAKRVFKPDVARKVRRMLEEVVKPGGTATQASVDGYRVSGKTGTVKKAGKGGYTEKNYFSVFVGMAPATNPRFVIAVIVDEPSGSQYYGGLVAAPVFSKVMTGALKIYGVKPDQQDAVPILLTDQGIKRTENDDTE